MGTLADICNTGLGLGLSLHDHGKPQNSFEKKKKKNRKKDPMKHNNLHPLSLTLGPSDHQKQIIPAKMEPGDHHDHHLHQQYYYSNYSDPSATSNSFSNSSSTKRERSEFGPGDQEEVEKVSNSRSVLVSDEDEDTACPRKKLRLTKEQSAILEDSFKEHPTLNPKQKQELAKRLNLRARQVEVWFQNRRARTKLKQTEMDHELLKKCCETLTEENKRLQKEIHELKSLCKTTGPFYMQLPAATLNMCPSCERICANGAVISSSTTNRLLIGGSSTKPHQLLACKSNPFSRSPATC